MSRFRFVCLGVGDAFSRRWYSSSMALECEGIWLLVDCPHPIRKVLSEAGQAAGLELDADRIAGVALTHTHADHCSGVEGLGYYCKYVLHRRPVLLTHRAAAEALDGGMRSLLAPPDGGEPTLLSDLFDVRLLSEDAPTGFGPFSIETHPTQHSLPTRALRITAGGRRLGLSADTGFDPDLIAWLSEADLVIHETNLGPHTPYESLAALPESIRSRMRLIHYPDDFDLTGSRIEPLRQGGVYEV